MNKRLQSFISLATGLGVGLTTDAAKLLVTDPKIGLGITAVGFLFAKVSENVLSDMSNRSLSQREQIRVGGAAVLSINRISAYLQDGLPPRTDDFFIESNGRRAPSVEIFEGVLLKCKNEHEENKIPFVANIYANVAFMEDVSIREANHLLHVAETLTYNQLCLLSLFSRKNAESIALRDTNYDEFLQIPHETETAIQEVFELYNSGLLNLINNPSNKDGEAIFGGSGVVPNRMNLTDLGKRYYALMNLEEVNLADLLEIAGALKN